MNPDSPKFPLWQERTLQLLGPEALRKLNEARVLLVGAGGVGGHAGEALVRAGIGHLAVVDFDTVQASNRNRQLAALSSTEGRSKTAVLKERFLDIAPELDLTVIDQAVTPENAGTLLDGSWALLLDAIDDVPAKCALLAEAVRRGIPTVSAMGAGGKLDPAQIRLADIGKTRECRLARQVRAGLRRYGIDRGVLAVYSTEAVRSEAFRPADRAAGVLRPVVGTISYMPAMFGLFMAAAAIRMLTAPRQQES